ncbi:pyridoxal phosphate-dependent aminotransferase [Dongia deserti]|uniref:pyridoxal phosphate-dependent aminotransferase n=1 Tax=Dongia deserti TaxID=2268030 RepID=UPI000E655A51|nr:histidinol-phosphate transaminase [Dongia deserti]
MSLIVRPGILDIAAYVPGDHSLPGEGPIHRMASNEGALGASPDAVEAYRTLAAELHRYPDGATKSLRVALGREHNIDPEQIVCGAGSDDVLQLLVRAYAGPGDDVLYSQHGFLVYPIAAKAVGATPVAAPETDLRTDVDALLKAVTPRTRICFVANPNNPTGSYVTHDELKRLRAGLPENVLLVIDAAYAEYVDVPDYETGLDMVRGADNVVMTRTFSKIFGLAALRLGWAYCPPAIADVLNRIRGPFNVPAPAQAAGVAALADRGHLAKAKAHNDYWLPWFTQRMRALGLHPYPSVANFVLVKFPADPKLNAEAALKFLNAQRILPRRVAAYGLPDCLRITIAEESAVKACADALEAFVKGAATQ